MINVSIIVPVYKVPLEYLRSCLDSLAAQTMQESEFLVVSDGAPEKECSVCEEYASKDSRFKFFKREHAGVSATRNYGIERAQGEYITFVDSDDWIEQDTISSVYNFAKKNNSDIVLWEAKQYINGFLKYGSFLNYSKARISVNQKKSFISNIIHTESTKFYSASLVACKLIKKSILNHFNIRFPENLSISEDRIFNIKALLHTENISYFHIFSYYYRIHPSSSSHKYIPEAFSKYTDFVFLLNDYIQHTYAESICNEIIHSFFLSWTAYYFHKENKSSFQKRVVQIIDITKSSFFHQAVSTYNKKKFPLIISIELFFITHRIYFLIYLHAIKALIIKYR